ncbi:ABC transporter substrate-binding protein [Paenibacillus dakarensis]|uniref:ABC transporter substrate-binding protein n=1 Tax=Paenibacillus dakarensis TaxID=1527293 RepID=UPI0006D56346|nr:ABC transporter substrate-binding protein [Paenibacillus dakarensis]
MKKSWKTVLAGVLTAALILPGCGSAGGASSGKTDVSMLIGKEEIAKELDETVAKYNSSQDKYNVKIIPLAGQNATEKLTSLYASKNAPVLINAGVYKELEAWKDKFLDLSDMPLVQGIDEQYLDAGKVDGKLIGIPTTIEAFGFLYNKDVLDEAVKGDFNPETIQSRADLEELMKQIEATGKKALEISPMDWSLGAHFSNVMFTNQSDDTAARHEFLKQLQEGKVDLANNQTFKDWVATFDLMKEHNTAKAAPLSADYDSATLQFANGDIGLWFMGNWAYPQIKEANPDANIGVMPVPIKEEAGAYGNTQISIGVPQTWTIDATQSTKEQQDGAKDFLNWMYEDEVGQDYYVNKLGFIPISKNNKIEPNDELSKSVLSYLQAEKNLEWMNAFYPPTGFPAMGASLQKYLDDKIDMTGLAAEFVDYWKTSAK